MDFTFEHTETGERREFIYGIGRAPGIGSCIETPLGIYRRIPDSPTIPAVLDVSRGYNVVRPSNSLWDWDPDAPRWDKDGRAVIQSARERREYLAKKRDCEHTNALGKEVVFDGRTGPMMAPDRKRPKRRKA